MRTAARTLAITALLLAALAASEEATPAEAKVDAAMLSGGDLPHPITLAFEDGVVFWALPDPRSNLDLPGGWPSRLDAAPPNPGTGYEFSSGIAAALLGNNPFGLWRGTEFGEGRLALATYYPAAEALELRIGDDAPRWARLDANRASILDRYIRLGRAAALPERPSILDVLAAEARAGTLTPVSVDGQPVPLPALETFWRTAGSNVWPEVPVHASLIGAKLQTDTPTDYDEAVEAMVYGSVEPVWLSLGVDGREVKLAYYPETGVIAGVPLPASSAWIGRGFAVPPELRDAFHASLGLPSLAPSSTPAETAVPRSESRTDPSAANRLEGRAGAATALALVGLAGLLAVASATLLRGTYVHRTA